MIDVELVYGLPTKYGSSEPMGTIDTGKDYLLSH